MNNCDINELYYISYKNFLEKHPETISMPRALALKRYNCYENMRNTKIQQIIDFREELINQENELNKNNKWRK